MSSTSPRRVWIVADVYYPEEAGAAYFVTRIAEGLSSRFPVHVLCSQPTYSALGVRAPLRETHRGVVIKRCKSTTLDKNVFRFKLANHVTIGLSIFFQALLSFNHHDIVLVVTSPPVLPFLVAIACQMRGAKCVLLLQDVYPEALVAARMFTQDALPVRIFSWLTKRLYRQMECITVLGRDMEALVKRKLNGVGSLKSVIIRNWADIDRVFPEDRNQNELLCQQGLTNKFVIQYAGNMGHPHGIEDLLEAARRLSVIDENIHFLFIGSGVKKPWLDDMVNKNNFRNVTVIPPRPRSDQQVFLNACDVAITAFVPGMTGVGVPSRMYNIFAAGKPIIGAVDAESELGLVVREENLGWIVPPSRPEKIVEAVLEARSDPRRLAEMGRRARTVAESKYTVNHVIDAYCALINSFVPNV